MDKELLDYTTEKVDVLLGAPSSSKTTLAACQAWKDALAAGADADEATTKLLDALDEHHTTIDELIVFARGAAKQMLGEDVATDMEAHALKRKEAGAKYCDCLACLTAQELLAKHGRPVL